MKFFLDTEFLENGETIRLISIGIVREDGEEYYAEAEMDSDLLLAVQAHPWLMANVVPHLTGEWKSRQQIAREVQEFTRCRGADEPEFWAYCGAYDWVVINQLYGPMVDHPKAWPYYCNDIAQHSLEVGVNRRTFPAQTSNAHNALDDARWTKETYHWINEQ